MRCIAVILFCAGLLPSQEVVTPDKLPEAVRNLDNSQTHSPLSCSLTPIKPSLDLGFRFQAGYTVQTSLDSYENGQHHWYIVFRVTPDPPQAGPPVFFLDSMDLPPVLASGFIAQTSGLFFLGEGTYDVKLILLDDLGRVCRKAWTTEAARPGNALAEVVTMPPGAVGDYSWRPPASPKPNPPARTRHITILLNAALPLSLRQRRNAGLPESAMAQWGSLLSILSSLLERMAEATVRLIVFDTDRQKELFRKEDFTSADISSIAHSADEMNRWAVDYGVLTKPAGVWDLLRGLEAGEIDSSPAPDTVIFLSLAGSSAGKLPSGLPGSAVKRPGFVYIRYGNVQPDVNPDDMSAGEGVRGGGGGGARGGGGGRGGRGLSISSITPPARFNGPDPIEQSVKSMKGKVAAVTSPADLEKALRKVETVAR